LTQTHPILWGAFGVLILTLFLVDLLVVNRRAHVLTVREAVRWTGTVLTAALLFGIVILVIGGTTPALEYYAGYLIELSLSVDNLFVFLLIFQYFAVPAVAQPRVLAWGILTAMILRGAMIALGTIILNRYEWVIYVFGAILFITAIRMYRDQGMQIHPERNPIMRLVRRFVPMVDNYDGEHFFTKTSRGWFATPLLMVLIVVDWTDLVFAIDSIPAVFAVTRDPFIVFSSNMLAIVGLRALYFVLADAMDRFKYLKPGVAIILGFVGLKMITSYWFHVSTALSLGVIITVLAGSIVMSLRSTKRTAIQ
jgi:tellurite resistance protein TerC